MGEGGLVLSGSTAVQRVFCRVPSGRASSAYTNWQYRAAASDDQRRQDRIARVAGRLMGGHRAQRENRRRGLEAVSKQHWDILLAGVIAAYAVWRNEPKMRDYVTRGVVGDDHACLRYAPGAAGYWFLKQPVVRNAVDEDLLLLLLR